MLENNNYLSLQELADTLKSGNGKLTVSDVGKWWAAFTNTTDTSLSHNFVVKDTIGWRDYGVGISMSCDKDSIFQVSKNV